MRGHDGHGRSDPEDQSGRPAMVTGMVVVLVMVLVVFVIIALLLNV